MRIPLLAAWLLVAAGLLRAFLLVSHAPLAGYGNQYDMVRTSACVSYWPALPAPARYEAHPEAPLVVYRHEDANRQACYPSTEVGIVAAAARVSAWIHGGAETLSLRAVGHAKLAMLALAVLVLAWALSAHPAAALFHGLVVALVLCDPVATLWMNTLYTEFGALWGLYAVVAALGTLALTGRGAWLVAALLLAGLVALAFSREQFALLPPLLVLAAWPWIRYRSRFLAAGAFGVALVATAVSFGVVQRPPGVREANRTDAYLGLILPSSTKPAEALETLGLPARCQAMVGATWYLQRGDDVHTTCPEVLGLSSTAFAGLLASEPQTLLRAAVRVIPTLQAISPPYVGVLQGARFATAASLPWWLASPLAAGVPRLPLAAFALVVLAGVLALPLAAVAALAWGRPSRALHGTGCMVALLLALVAAYSFGTTVFGDGIAESARHFLPGMLALAAMALGAPVALALLFASRRERWRHGALEAAAAVLAVAAIAGAAAVLEEWSAAQPLAFGVIDQPVGRAIAGDLGVRGWALDPYGVAAIEVRIGDRVLPARRYGEPDDALARHFPGYPDATGARFAVDIPAAELAAAGANGAVEMRTVLRNRQGIATEIDRRMLAIAP